MSDETGNRGRKSRQTKDRVLQARIPEQLDDELRDRAEELGLSVSTIVRNVLLNTFDLVEGVVSDSSQIARALTRRDAPSTSNPKSLALSHTAEDTPASTLIGWQEAILNKNGVCEQCNEILQKGSRAAIGVPAGPRPVLLCTKCLEKLTASSAKSPAVKTRKKAASKKAAAKKAPKGDAKTAG